MSSETKTCQNCKQNFVIEPEDFKFYEKMSVPPPTFCPECRFQRRLMFRNERALYKDKCDLCGKDMISVFSPEKPFKVYCSPCWWSDNWDPLESGQEYDPSRNFFEQMKEVQMKSPFMNLIVGYASLVNSDYVNHAGNLKNCYLMYNGDFNENVHYSEMVTNDRDMMDASIVGESELCYEMTNGHKLYKVFFSEDCNDSHNVYFSGDYVFESKNAHFVYQGRYIENGRFIQFINLASVKDAYDYTEWGMGAQRIIDAITTGMQADNIKFSSGVWDSVMNVEYSMYNVSCSNMFGCVNVRKKRYCILNKQYTEEEYKKLRAKIIEDMKARPHVDSKGRVFKYGEFLPYDLSLFAYNESTASWYFPLSKKSVLEQGWRWREPIPLPYKATVKTEDIPDSINDVKDDIVNEVLECLECKGVYRIIDRELNLLRRFGFPLPRKWPNCRYKERLSRINPPRLWDRKCDRCGADIKTSYAPERPEKIYCTKCYQEEFI